MYTFGSGFLYGIPTADASGAAIANPTPVPFGVLQEVSLDISFETKMLHGQNQMPVAVGRGKGKMSGKAKFADIRGLTYNQIFFGTALSANIVAAVNDITGATIPTTPFTITPTVPLSGTWARDLGVRNGVSGAYMTRVASAPTTGQYSVAAGVYTFAAADTGILVFISYEYTATSASAKQFTFVNQPMGYAPTFMMVLSNPFQGKNLHMRLPQCVSSKMAMAFKNDDFNIPELDFDAFADVSGNCYTMAMSD